MNLWWVWLIVAAVLMVAEIFTAGFFLFWFGIGAAAAGVLALLGLGQAVQWLTFIILSGALFSVSRRFAEKVTAAQPSGIGADRFVGMRGMVLETVDNDANTGRVRLDKEEWRADSVDGRVIGPGTKVVVVKVKGTRAIVAIDEGG